MNHECDDRKSSFWKSGQGIALCVTVAIAALYLMTEHRAHLWEWLPYAVLLLCPLMHLFMHGGHSHGGHRGRVDEAEKPDRDRH